jgi:uncharacterized protein YdaU (DUF1376 family)
MSLPYYRFFPGDYYRDTRHLSMLQHGAYRLLIDMYMDHGGPIPNDLPKLYRWLRAESVEEKSALEFVLTEFFMLSTGSKDLSTGWKHKRCELELQWRSGKVAKASESAKQRWLSERTADVMRTHSDGNANQNQNYITTKAARETHANQLPKLQWWETESGMLAKGKQLGTEPRAGEGWTQFKERLFVTIKAKA